MCQCSIKVFGRIREPYRVFPEGARPWAVSEIVSTASWGYLRLRRAEYTEADLSRWLEKILAQPWEQVFVFFKHEEDASGPVSGPEVALRFRELADSRGIT